MTAETKIESAFALLIANRVAFEQVTINAKNQSKTISTLPSTLKIAPKGLMLKTWLGSLSAKSIWSMS